MPTLVDAFITQVIANSDYTNDDHFYLRNRVLALVGEDGANQTTTLSKIIPLRDALLDLAVANGKVGDLAEERDTLGAELMNFITPVPSVVNRQFWTTYQDSPDQAIQDFYDLSQRNDYIKVAAIAKNIAYTSATKYGDMEITINLSKPEKDPKAIAAAKQAKSSSYPLCQLCMENEGYQGRINHPARANHRIIRMQLGDEEWGFQYSPYAYFNEHSIVLNTQHVPMVISQQTFEQLLAIVDIFPGYFAGSNADLPIVGGSILTHNHYQTGRHEFPMAKAAFESQFTFKDFPDIQAGIVKWPMSVIRLQGTVQSDLVALAEKIRLTWLSYEDPAQDVIAYTGDEPHHTITPIARKRGDVFELDLVLRDNHTSSEHPDGVYHPHKDVQHIKKENIGLIEVMGLAILPPRLKDELAEVEGYLLGKDNKIADYHLPWADEIKKRHDINDQNVAAMVRDEVGQVFARVLEDAGIYKDTAEGKEGFLRFVRSVGLAE
ncbi:UDP-glucose--hexose-1-phosphate uridylyltransferase [Aerococcus agrisoli]|uniref:Galactose-1-phosphate uridylyltransferase n=1 Tax=Aerococcus agrisoli TaxID=2487350 RepID=A0A3N4GCD1_9LACT|nr:UDP-glucose--hexose-1-phosphate uridylyltransferase [Aerococcus agrisoli]RPA59845.1 UDP-glucose--hexose-1-phosphate uridylyltransferase [Aerococcus agrisoli]